MEQKNNSVCAICGKGYYLCLNCKEAQAFNSWRLHTDSPEHYKIFQIIHSYTIGVFNKEEAKRRFENVDLSDLDVLRPHIKNIIKDIIDINDTNSNDEVDNIEINDIKEIEVNKENKVSRRKKKEIN